MRGPPPTPNVIKILRGNPGKRRIGVEPEPQIDESAPEAPSFLTGYAADEWWRVAPELHRLRLLTVVDVMPLAAYCQAYDTWRTAVETLHAIAARDKATSGMLVKTATGDPAQNPLLGIARRAAGEWFAVLASLACHPPRVPASALAWATSRRRAENSTA
jgi:P27 family predicted phage terminase small subunit